MFKRIMLVSAVLAIALFASEAIESGKVLAAKPSAVLQHCSNSFYDNVQPCSGGAWIPGVLDANTSDYAEGDSVPYRVILSNFVEGSPGNTITISWDSTKGGPHALDYLTSFDRTLTLGSGNTPCDVATAGCGIFTTFPVPVDGAVSGAGVTQASGVFTLFGGTITSVSGYSNSGPAGKRSTNITVTFTADRSKMVLAWGGHLARDADWGSLGGSASDVAGNIQTRISGSSVGSGSQSRSITSVSSMSRIVIITQSAPESDQAMTFSTSANGPGAFTLIDDGVDDDATPNNRAFDLVPGAYTFTVTENGPYSLTNLTCSVSGDGGSTSTPNVPASLVNVTLKSGDVVTCAFFNSIATPTPTPTAAE
jgi:hypothetical protein